ncbi:hypothetical protein JCM30471_09940 [Desulfuromonas carbonis]|nr:UDP-glucuronate decarboxylase [Desulfuromonas sp. DDH964]
MQQALAKEIILSKAAEESLEKILKEKDLQFWIEEYLEAMATANRPRSGSRWHGSSTPTVRACTPTTAAWSPTSSSRRCGGRLTLCGDGSQSRSFCYVDDLIDGLVALMESGDAVTGPINLGNPTEFTIRQLAELVIELTGSPSRVVYKPLPSDDPKQRQPDITLARQTLGWEPTVQLREGLVRTIEYFDKLLRDGG